MSNSRLKSFIDRVLRLKEEEDTIKADIREVYAEMKGEGYDKTAAGQLVAYLRKVEKKGREEIEAANTVFDLYLNEYENGTALATHTHENSYSPEKATVMDRATESSFETGSAAAENARVGIPVEPEDGSANHAGAGESPATVSLSSASPASQAADEESLTGHVTSTGEALLSGQD
ncbi:GapR family DNA-binding domain-containing protein [Ochrobactrum sp. Marseille-Q0166]|uniref:DUF2312 domain-containing protein n=1 Tax=Ochrobactrum sp. Marseille-Q0166 TaxID=2761105 RepID=UPI00165552D6|nr:GapR family DNA-binding domain-containing protein [Ochrobactrum sp. Marseille-Q0166]MBC8718793.1 DUF2312 domain-containing protein [Ochrobactrum sp. Marseille-Q0166]